MYERDDAELSALAQQAGLTPQLASGPWFVAVAGRP